MIACTTCPLKRRRGERMETFWDRQHDCTAECPGARSSRPRTEDRTARRPAVLKVAPE